jgi:hypothetical protein
MVAALAGGDGHVLHTICWKGPDQNPTVLSMLRSFRAAALTVEDVMEPSGTYGDVLRHQLEQDAFPVFMVSGKCTHDAKEIFDGVPSLQEAGPRGHPTGAFRLPGRLPPDLSPAQSSFTPDPFHRIFLTAERISCAHQNPDHSPFFLLALPTNASTAC